MKIVTMGRGGDRIYEIPETWVEAEKMIDAAIKQASGRGHNSQIAGVCSRIAFGLTCDQTMTPDPTTALAFLFQRICQRKGAGLDSQKA